MSDKPMKNCSTEFVIRSVQAKTTMRASLVAQTVKNLSVMQGTRVRSLGWEDPLEKGMATHYCILTWRIP